MELRKLVREVICKCLSENTNKQKHELPEYWYHGTNKYFGELPTHSIADGMGFYVSRTGYCLTLRYTRLVPKP